MHRFYDPEISDNSNQLPEEESKHCALILRHKQGDKIVVLDGKGGRYTCELTKVSKNQCLYKVIESETAPSKKFRIHLIIAPTKNLDRMEWLVEKLSEVGVDQLTFIETQNSERRKLRLDRLEKKAISALKQSGNPFLMEVKDLTSFKEAIDTDQSDLKLIAHVSEEHSHISDAVTANQNTTILIGPEGDFTNEELEYASNKEFLPISLGTNTLRTETAGFVACCQVNFVNGY